MVSSGEGLMRRTKRRSPMNDEPLGRLLATSMRVASSSKSSSSLTKVTSECFDREFAGHSAESRPALALPSPMLLGVEDRETVTRAAIRLGVLIEDKRYTFESERDLHLDYTTMIKFSRGERPKCQRQIMCVRTAVSLS